MIPGASVDPRAHHTHGGFRNPWPTGGGGDSFRDLLRWLVERARTGRAAHGIASDIPRQAPRLPTDVDRGGRTAATWLGHSTVLLQFDGVTALTDPVWARHLSPVPFTGPERWVPPMLALDDLPPIDVVLQSHNHYDHFDASATRRIARRNPHATWCVPLGMGAAVRARGVRNVRELDWWGSANVDVMRSGAHAIRCTVTAVPAQHFSGRSLTDRDRSLWCGWTLAVGDARVYFAGDTAFHPLFGEIARRCGPFDLSIVPIGAYEPRWFMSRVHMNPDEAVAAWRCMAQVQEQEHHVNAPPMLGVHWGTYSLTNEPMIEPPRRTLDLWREAALDIESLWLLAHGESRIVRRS